VTKHFFSCPKIFFLGRRGFFSVFFRKMFLLQEEKKTCGKEKTVLLLHQEEFSWRQKKLCE